MSLVSKRLRSIALGGVLCTAAASLHCQKDYNPFENITNAQIHVSPEASSRRIRDNDTLSIFTRETLAVNVTVREKIDSIVVIARGNRLWSDTVLRPPFTPDNYLFQLSYPDTGWHAVTASAYRVNGTAFTAGPFSYYVGSPLHQDSLFYPYGVDTTLSTPPVGDIDVYYWWSFGTGPNDTVQSPFNHIDTRLPDSVKIGVKMTGYLWVTDTAEKISSPASTFSYEFYRPAVPVIKCTNKGLLGDSVISGSDTLVFNVEVIDSSRVGIRSVVINGVSVTTTDNLDYSVVYTGMKAYLPPAEPKVVTVVAVNNLNDSTVNTFYCLYEPNGTLPDLVRLTFINPTTSITTTQSSIPLLIGVNKYTQDTVTVRAFLDTQSLTPKTQIVTDTFKTLVWVPQQLPTGRDTITVNALIHGQKYAADTIIITQDPAYKDTSPPEILSITINGRPYTTGTSFALLPSDTSVKVTVVAFDNESGIDSVKVVSGVKSYPLAYNLSLLSWSSASIPFAGAGATVRKTMLLTLTVKNNAGKTNPKVITITKN
jgi:hypothetical protein